MEVSLAVTQETTYEVEIHGGFNYQAWLTAGRVSETFESLDDILADEPTLRQLFLVHDSVDYICDTFAAGSLADVTKIFNTDLAAKWINLSDYALDHFYAVSGIKSIMDTADEYGYGELALMPQVPRMTSDTTPYGEAFAGATASGRYPYSAFNGTPSESTMWYQGGSFDESTAYLGYHFNKPVIVRKIQYKGCTSDGGRDVKEGIVQASNDGVTWENIYSFTGNMHTNNTNVIETLSFSNGTPYLYYRVKANSTWATNTNSGLAFEMLQFFAYAPKGNIPVMASTTAPYGQIISTGNFGGGNDVTYIFDGNEATIGIAQPNGTRGSAFFVGYRFVNPVCVKRVYHSSSSSIALNCTIRASNDNSTWTTFDTYVATAGGQIYTDIDNDDYYLYWKIDCTYVTSTDWGSIRELQFFGRELKVSVPVMTSNTAPYGEASASSTLSGYDAYKAFQEDTANNPSWIANTAAAGAWLQYKFTSSVFIKKAYIRLNDGGNGTRWPSYVKIYKIVGSTATEVSTFNPDRTAATVYMVDVGTECDGIRYEFGAVPYDGVQVFYANFYGLDYSEKEFEEGTTKKWLYDHGVMVEEIILANNGSNTLAQDNGEVITLNGGNGTVQSTGAMAYRGRIDLTSFANMRVKVANASVTGSVFLTLVISSVDPPSYNWNVSVVSMTDVYTSSAVVPNNIVIDISNVSGLNNPCLIAYRSENHYMRKAEITEWWLE